MGPGAGAQQGRSEAPPGVEGDLGGGLRDVWNDLGEDLHHQRLAVPVVVQKNDPVVACSPAECDAFTPCATQRRFVKENISGRALHDMTGLRGQACTKLHQIQQEQMVCGSITEPTMQPDRVQTKI